MNATTISSARVYVGTYAKYNNGSIQGAWLDLDDYADHDAFIEACQALHADEDDPELMFQDYEGFPRDYYAESSLNPDVWDWLELSEDEQAMLAAYLEHVNQDGTLEEAQDAYQGEHESELAFAYSLVDDSDMLSEMPENLRYYFDYEAFARDLFISDYIYADGHVFTRY